MAQGNIPEVKIRGRVLTIRTARKWHKCSECGLPIFPQEQYYQVTIGGGGLGSLKFPDRVHQNCIENYGGKTSGTKD